MKINSLRQDGLKNDKAELKELKNLLLNVIIKVATSEDIQNCADDGIKSGGMGFSADTPMEYGEMLELEEFMRHK